MNRASAPVCVRDGTISETTGKPKSRPADHSPMDDCRSVHFRRYSLGAMPISRLKTRLKDPSDSYPQAAATSENDALFERIKEPALNIRHRVRYSRGV